MKGFNQKALNNAVLATAYLVEEVFGKFYLSKLKKLTARDFEEYLELGITQEQLDIAMFDTCNRVNITVDC
tara:strand:+ start:3161 stop:3373 length:213 start_codon:yes stop_codon:yes gene_type:complete